jgi:hypothetical protein
MNISVFQQSEIVIKKQSETSQNILPDSLALKQYFYEENLDDDDLVFEDDCMDDYTVGRDKEMANSMGEPAVDAAPFIHPTRTHPQTLFLPPFALR